MFNLKQINAYALGRDGSEFTDDEVEFLKAISAYQKQFHRRYPTWREVLYVARCLGYRKVAPASIAVEPQTSTAA